MEPDKPKGTSEIEQVRKRRDRQYEELGRLAGMVSQAESIEKGLERVLDRMLVFANAEVGTVHIVDPSSGALALIAWRGVSGRFACSERQIPMGDCLCGESAEEGRLLASDVMWRDSRITRTACETDQFGSVLSIPLKSNGRVIGIFAIFSKQPYRFSGMDRDLLILLGDQIGMAIDNVNRYSQTWEKAVSQERGYLAREIHDSIAQSLAYLNLQSRQAEDSLKSGDPGLALKQLETIREGVRIAYEDVRQLMADFRVGLDGDADLIKAICRYVQEFSQRTGIHVTVDYDSPEIRLAPRAQVQVFRILQEALSNVRRHASATSITVELRSQANPVCLKVADDGNGFDPGILPNTGETHLGLNIMRERVADLNGRLELVTKPGQGTTLEIFVPVQEPSGG